MMTPQLGTTVDERFLLEEALGETHGATLYRARDIMLGRTVAFRLLNESVFAHDVRSRNLLQLQRSRAFVHQNVVTIHDVVCKPDIAYLVSDWVEGMPLSSRVEQSGPCELAEIIQLLSDLKEALQWIHQIAECGRLNPGNVYFHDGHLVLTEPYFIRLAASESTDWNAFLAPEQKGVEWSGGAPADFYAAAMLMGYLLTGKELEPGVALSKQTDRSSPPLDAAFVVATQGNPTLREVSLDPLLLALRGLSEETENSDGSDTVEFRSVFSQDGELVQARTEGSGSIDFGKPEDLEVADTSRDLSVDARLHEEPRRPRQDTIELDLTDASVLVVQDSAPSLPSTPAGDEANVQDAAVADTLEQKLPAFNAGVAVPPESQATSEDQGDGSPETEQFQMVSDQAVFDASSLPSKPGTRDEYDTLEADFVEQDMDSRGEPYVSSETQAFQRADMVGSRSTTEQRGATGSMAVLLILLAAGLVAYVMLRDKPTTNTLAKQNTKNATSKTVKKVMPPPGSSSTAGAPGQGTRLSAADVVQPQGDQGALHGESVAPPRDIVASKDSADVGDGVADILPNDDAISAEQDTTVTESSESVDDRQLPPATDRKQFTCNGNDMALVTKRATIKQADGSSLRIISKAYCVDKHEYPGKGAIPHTNVSLAQAKQGCKSRGRRLCTASEWRGACGGRYPYKGAYEPGRCNAMVELGNSRPIAAAGAFSRCKSGWGTYDMVGNVAEWTSAGNIHGGSYQLDGEEANCNRKRTRLDPSPKVGYRCCANAKRKDLK